MSTPQTKKCSHCDATYDSSVHFCLNDGMQLVPNDDLTGKLLDGRYRIEKVLGRGGMGVVYQATHIHIDTQVAVKVLNHELVSNQAAIERFRREAKAAGRIHHPNAIQVTDFGVAEDKTVYLVMELVDGQSLHDLIWEKKTFEPQHAVNLMMQICSAVEAAHHSGIIHRDLKPDNILIRNRDGVEEVKVVDFGIAKLKHRTDIDKGPTHTLTQVGTIIGTPHYMSPEQCRGKDLDPCSDIYSLGIITYEMLCGDPPFSGDSAVEIVAKHLKDMPRPLRELRPEIPVALERTVMRAIEKDPTRRPASASEFSRELVEALTDNAATGENRALKTLHDAPSEKTQPGEVARTFSGDSAEATFSSSVPASKTKAVVTSPAATAGTGGTSRSPMMLIGAVIVVAIIGLGAYLLWPRPVEKPKGGGSVQPTPVVVPEMALIPGGKFMMGRNDGDQDERPAHEVQVKSFYLDKFEITNQQYKKFTDATNRTIPQHWKNNGSFSPEEATLPVTFVTWQDAADYAKWVGKRLPREDEWEYAARGGSKENLYPWGNQWIAANANANRLRQARPAPIRSFEQDISAFAIYDLAGNVSEWVQDSFSRYETKQGDKWKVYRGGNFTTDPAQSTATYRWYDFPAPPQDAKQKKEYTEKVFPVVGFRCARDADK